MAIRKRGFCASSPYTHLNEVRTKIYIYITLIVTHHPKIEFIRLEMFDVNIPDADACVRRAQ